MPNSTQKAIGIEKELATVILFDDSSNVTGEEITNIEDYLGIEKNRK